MLSCNIAKCLVVLLAATSLAFCADDQNSSAAIQKALESEYALTKPTADKKDIVTAGAVLVLEKDNLLSTDVSSPSIGGNTYKDGSLHNAAKALSVFGRGKKWIPGASSAPDVNTRTFVAGEKLWVTKIDVTDEKVIFTLFSDPMSDVRYQATVTFFGKHRPAADVVEKTVAEVFKVQPAEDANAGGQNQNAAQGAATPQQPQAPAAAASAEKAPAAIAPPAPPSSEAAPAPIAPPAPPSDSAAAPQTVALGQSPDQVKAILGQPQTIVKAGAKPKKEIYVYKELKVTFVNDKVTDVQ